MRDGRYIILLSVERYGLEPQLCELIRSLARGLCQFLKPQANEHSGIPCLP